MTTNGQAPFITLFMYLGEARNEQEKKDLALIIEEVLKQRMLGVKNEVSLQRDAEEQCRGFGGLYARV